MFFFNHFVHASHQRKIFGGKTRDTTQNVNINSNTHMIMTQHVFNEIFYRYKHNFTYLSYKMTDNEIFYNLQTY